MEEDAAWIQWRIRCALGLCPPEAQAPLRDFAYAAFRHYVAIYASTARMPDAGALTPPREEAWHCFETHLRIRNNREGKSYKDWLFSRAVRPGSSTLDCIRGGATLLMRDVVRAYLRRETSPPGTQGLETPIGPCADGGGLTLRDLLPDTSDTRSSVARNEVLSLAEAATAPVFAMIGRRERIALLARELGLSLAHPLVTAVADCRKSVLFTAYRKALEGLAEGVRKRYPDVGTSAMAEISILVFGYIRQAVIDWGRSEEGCRRLFAAGTAQSASLHPAECR